MESGLGRWSPTEPPFPECTMYSVQLPLQFILCILTNHLLRIYHLEGLLYRTWIWNRCYVLLPKYVPTNVLLPQDIKAISRRLYVTRALKCAAARSTNLQILWKKSDPHVAVYKCTFIVKYRSEKNKEEHKRDFANQSNAKEFWTNSWRCWICFWGRCFCIGLDLDCVTVELSITTKYHISALEEAL